MGATARLTIQHRQCSARLQHGLGAIRPPGSLLPALGDSWERRLRCCALEAASSIRRQVAGTPRVRRTCPLPALARWPRTSATLRSIWAGRERPLSAAGRPHSGASRSVIHLSCGRYTANQQASCPPCEPLFPCPLQAELHLHGVWDTLRARGGGRWTRRAARRVPENHRRFHRIHRTGKAPIRAIMPAMRTRSFCSSTYCCSASAEVNRQRLTSMAVGQRRAV